MAVTREVEDTLDDVERELIDGLEEAVTDWLNDNPDAEEAPDMDTLDYGGGIHERIDGAVPIWYSELDALWFFHHDKFEQAFENHGFEGSASDKNGAVAIYCYLSDLACEWFRDEKHQSVYDEWRETHLLEDPEED